MSKTWFSGTRRSMLSRSGQAGQLHWRRKSTRVRSNLENMDPGLARKIAENEARFRTANEKIEAARLRLDADPITVPFVCECGRMECLQTIRLTIAEYESV